MEGPCTRSDLDALLHRLAIVMSLIEAASDVPQELLIERVKLVASISRARSLADGSQRTRDPRPSSTPLRLLHSSET